jgi:hypothetical protein
MSFFQDFLGFYRVSSFFRISGATTGEKRNPHPNPILRGSGLGHGCKNAPELASVGCKTRGLLKTRTVIPKPALSFEGAHRGKMCMCMFIEVSARTCISIYVYTVFLKKKTPLKRKKVSDLLA